MLIVILLYEKEWKVNKYKFFGAISMVKESKNIDCAIDEFVMEDNMCLASFHPKFIEINGATVARIISIINIRDEEEPISYERHPIYVCLESDYDKVKHLDD
jgi:hypothetical protein